MPKGQAQDKLRESKRNHIFNIIVGSKDLSKIDIKRISGYSMTSVISLIDELVKSSLVTAVDSGISSGGRPPVKININSDGGHIIGIDWSRENINCAVYNLRREKVLSIEERTDDITSITQFIDKLIAIINRAKAEVLATIETFNLLGVGIGVPGYIDETKGTVSRYTHIYDYKDVPVRELLENALNVPVFLQNNVNAMALGYKWLKKEGNINSLLVIAVRRGVKAGLIINNQLIKGANDYAGEIGTLKVSSEGEITGGSISTYEEILSDYTVARKVGINKVSEIIDKAKDSDSFCISYLKELADVLSNLINNAMALINPEEILLVGGYVGSEYFLDLIRERNNGTIVGGSAEELGTVGAAGLVIEKLFSY